MHQAARVDGTGAPLAIAPDEGEMITLAEAARRTGTPYITLRRQAQSGQLAARKVGRVWQVDAASLPAAPPREPIEQKIHELPGRAQRFIGVVDTGVLDQLEQLRAENARLWRQLERESASRDRLQSALVERLRPPS